MLNNNQRTRLVLFPFKHSGKSLHPAIPFLKNQYFRLKNESTTESVFTRIKKTGYRLIPVTHLPLFRLARSEKLVCQSKGLLARNALLAIANITKKLHHQMPLSKNY
jgi:hypothetical protein